MPFREPGGLHVLQTPPHRLAANSCRRLALLSRRRKRSPVSCLERSAENVAIRFPGSTIGTSAATSAGDRSRSRSLVASPRREQLAARLLGRAARRAPRARLRSSAARVVRRSLNCLPPGSSPFGKSRCRIGRSSFRRVSSRTASNGRRRCFTVGTTGSPRHAS